jgi:hypothetical protein
MRRYVFRRPHFIGQRLELLVSILVAVTEGAPAADAMPMAIHHYQMAGGL